MRKMVGRVVVIALCLAGSLLADDFRNATWGMSKAEVKATEADKVVHDESISVVAYKDRVAGFDTMVGYGFAKGKLVWGMYQFQIEHTNLNDYFADCDNVKSILTKKYGKPSMDRVAWENDLYKDDRQNWGTAVAMGHLGCLAVWENDSTEIVLALRGENFKVILATKYTSKKLRHLKQEEDAKRDAEKF